MEQYRRLDSLIRRLIEIDSQNPPGDESRVAKFVGSYLRRMGLVPEFVEYAPRRTNVIARLKGKGQGELLVTPHLDTVPAGTNWKRNPFNPSLEKGRLYGLGATDCKGNLACCLEAMHRLVERRACLRYDLVFCATADEESGSRLGLELLIEKKRIRPDAAIVLDTDDFQIIVAQKGLLHLKLKVRGKRAHGAYTWLGSNAIDATARIIDALKRERLEFSPNPYLHPPTINTGTVHGGDKVNIVADWCEVEFDFRFLPGMRHEAFIASLRRLARRFTRSFEIEIEGVQQPYEISPEHPLVKKLAAAMKGRGKRLRLTGSEGATVISFFQAAGIPSVATGFGTSGCCHVADEYVELRNLREGAEVLTDFFRDFSFEPTSLNGRGRGWKK